jgi:hypothetical protein
MVEKVVKQEVKQVGNKKIITTTTTTTTTAPADGTTGGKKITVIKKPTIVHTQTQPQTVVQTQPTTTTTTTTTTRPPRRYNVKVNGEGKASKITQHLNEQINKKMWSPDVKKFYDDRDGDNFKRSDCKGNRKALYVGINYIGGKSPLKGCINDVHNISQLIAKRFGFTSAVILTDDQADEKKKPTYDNIINAMKWLVQDAKAGDSLFFHFSGHGGTTRDKDGDELDGFDESILPCDYLTNGQIVDDVIRENLVEPLPQGCRLTAIFDSCHSGTIMDLPYTYQYGENVQVVENDVRREVFKKTNEVVNSLIEGNPTKIRNSLSGIFNGSLRQVAKRGTDKEVVQKRQRTGEVIQLSGCKDNQTSADAKIGNVSTGAMSYAIITLLSQDKEYTYNELITGVRDVMREKKFTQIPQISTSRPINMNETFYI